MQTLPASLGTARSQRGVMLIRAIGVALILSSFLKFAHPAPVVDYMGSMGYAGTTYFVIAVGELIIAVLLLVPRSRWPGLLLASAYFGGAVAAHLAMHRYIVGGPFLEFMATNPFVGALLPGAFLMVLWVGAWLYWAERLYPSARQAARAPDELGRKLSAA